RPVILIEKPESGVLFKTGTRIRRCMGKQGSRHYPLVDENGTLRRARPVATVVTRTLYSGFRETEDYSPAALCWRTGFCACTSSATRNASSSAWLALRRGSQSHLE